LGNNRRKLALFFDAENLSLKSAASILQRLAKDGWDVHLRRAYGSNIASQQAILQELSIIPVEVLRNTKAKNAADIALAVDAVEELCEGTCDGICLVSGDSDFTRLVQRIRERGLDAVVFGTAAAPASLRNACTEFHLVTPSEREENSKPVAAPRPKTAKVVVAPDAMSDSDAAKLQRDLSRVFQEFAAASSETTVQKFGQFLKNHHPHLQPRAFGFARLRALLNKVGSFQIEPVVRPDGAVGDYRLSLRSTDAKISDSGGRFGD
jgi:hypothetical protein